MLWLWWAGQGNELSPCSLSLSWVLCTLEKASVTHKATANQTSLVLLSLNYLRFGAYLVDWINKPFQSLVISSVFDTLPVVVWHNYASQQGSSAEASCRNAMFSSRFFFPIFFPEFHSVLRISQTALPFFLENHNCNCYAVHTFLITVFLSTIWKIDYRETKHFLCLQLEVALVNNHEIVISHL